MIMKFEVGKLYQFQNKFERGVPAAVVAKARSHELSGMLGNLKDGGLFIFLADQDEEDSVLYKIMTTDGVIGYVRVYEDEIVEVKDSHAC